MPLDNGFDAEEHVQAEPEASAEILSAFGLTPLNREYYSSVSQPW